VHLEPKYLVSLCLKIKKDLFFSSQVMGEGRSRTRFGGGTATLISLGLLLLFLNKKAVCNPQEGEGLSPSLEERRIMMCSDRLLQGIQSFCKNPIQFHAMMALGHHNRKRSQGQGQVPMDQGQGQGQAVVYEEDEGYEDEDENENEEDDQDFEEDEHLVREQSSLYSYEITRKNIVDACCRNSCRVDEFQQFCAMSKYG
jgi:hypothetical protein